MKKETTLSVAVIKKELPAEVVKVNKLVISDEKSLNVGVEYLSRANSYLKALTADKEKITKPLNEALKAARAKYKSTEEILEAMISDLREKIGDYKTEADAKLKAEEEKIANDLASGKIKKVETAVRKIDELDQVPESVSTESGKVKFRSVKKFEVTDLRQVPFEYHLANEAEIRRLMNNGIKITGIRYYEEQVPINSTY